MDVVHTLCVIFIWDGGHCLEMLCSLLNISGQNPGISSSVLSRNWPSENTKFTHFIKYKKVSRVHKSSALYWTKGRTPNICAFFSRRLWTRPRNFISFIEHEKVCWVQKFNVLYWTRDGWQSPKISCHLFNTNRWSEWRNSESFIEHETVVRVQKLGVLYWTENYGPCIGNVTDYDNSQHLIGHSNYKNMNRCVLFTSGKSSHIIQCLLIHPLLRTH